VKTPTLPIQPGASLPPEPTAPIRRWFTTPRCETMTTIRWVCAKRRSSSAMAIQPMPKWSAPASPPPSLNSPRPTGADLRCIEPSATIDGRLIICQGHPTEPGKIDNLVYSWNSSPGATTNWRVNKSIATGTVRLFTMQNGIELFLANGSTLTGVMQDTAGVRRQLNGPAIASGSWVHVAFSYNPFNKNQSLWVNGARVANTTVTGFGTLQTSGAVQVGPVNSTASIPSHLTSLRVTRHLQWIASAALPQALARPCSTM
jgi:hypothetical protein